MKSCSMKLSTNLMAKVTNTEKKIKHKIKKNEDKNSKVFKFNNCQNGGRYGWNQEKEKPKEIHNGFNYSI